MKFNTENNLIDIQSPFNVLKNKFLIPSRCTFKELALMIGFKRWQDLNGMWSHSVIQRISKVTNTSPRYWYYQQLNWRFHNYLIKRKSDRSIKEVPVKFHIHKEIAITPLIAYRLSKSLQTSIKYWLDLQSAYEVHLLIKSDLIRDLNIKESLISFRNTIYSNLHGNSIYKKEHEVPYPGKLLKKKYLESFKVHMLDWQHLFCLSRKIFNGVMHGKSNMPLSLIMKLRTIFKTDCEYWINAQNAYCAWKALQCYRRMKRQPKVIYNLPTISGQHPFQILINGFLKHMDISPSAFLIHLNLNAKSYKSLEKGRKKIDFELAIRFGQALKMDPRYWLYLQLEYDIKEFEQGRHGAHLH